MVCVSAAHPFYGNTARLAAHGACACVPLHPTDAVAEGQVLQVAPHTAILGRWNPQARIGTSTRSDAEIPHQNMGTGNLHSAFLWESALGNDDNGWF